MQIDLISNMVREFCESRGIEVLDMTPIFRGRAPAGEQLYFRCDSHMKANAHRLVAEALAQRLADDTRGNLTR